MGVNVWKENAPLVLNSTVCIGEFVKIPTLMLMYSSHLHSKKVLYLIIWNFYFQEKFLVGVHGKSQVFLGVYFTPVTMLTTLSTTKTKIML